MFATAFLAIGAQHSVGHLWSRRHHGRCRASMEPEGGGPRAKWLKHLQIFDFWREFTQRWPSRRWAVSPRQARPRLRAWPRRSRYLIVVGASLRSRTPAKTAKAPSSLRSCTAPAARTATSRSWSSTSSSNPQTVATTAADRVADERMRLLASKLAALYRDAAAARIGSGQFVLQGVAGLHGTLDGPVKMSSPRLPHAVGRVLPLQVQGRDRRNRSSSRCAPPPYPDRDAPKLVEHVVEQLG